MKTVGQAHYSVQEISLLGKHIKFFLNIEINLKHVCNKNLY